MKRKKYCNDKRKKWKDWMPKNCAKTCEVCRSEIVKVCEDGRGTKSCKKWADRKLCGDQKYGSFMAKNCAKTCKICN